MTSEPPRVSLITPVYNRERYLGEALESAIDQSYTDWELIAWDDGSEDRSLAIAEAYAARDARIRAHGGERVGLAHALAAAIAASNAPYIGILDSDDLLEARALTQTVAVLDENPDVGMVYTDYVNIDAQGKVLGYGSRCRIPYSPERLLVDFMTFHFRLMRRTVFEQVGGIDLELGGAPDYDLCLRLSEVTTFAHLPAPLYFYRVHPASLSLSSQEIQREHTHRAVQKALTRRGLDGELTVERLDGGRLRLVRKA